MFIAFAILCLSKLSNRLHQQVIVTSQNDCIIAIMEGLLLWLFQILTKTNICFDHVKKMTYYTWKLIKK